MSDQILHRWERDEMRRGFVCVKPEIKITSNLRCHGCGKFISDKNIYNVFGHSNIVSISAALNLLAHEQKKA